MPTITLSDEQDRELFTTEVSAGGIGRLFKGGASLKALGALASALGRPLADASGRRDLEMSLAGSLKVGEAGEVAVSAGTRAAIGVHQAGETLFAGSGVAAEMAVPNGTAFVSVSAEALLRAAFSGSAGRVGFGLSAGTAVRFGYFQPFDVAGDPALTVKDALAATLAAAALPGGADDLERMVAGSVVSVAGEGELAFTAKAALSATTNLLATPGLPLVGSIVARQAASLEVEAAWKASGAFELRVSRPDATRARIAYHRRHGRSLDVSARALLGVTAGTGKHDLLALLMGALGGDPQADVRALVEAGASDAQIDDIQQAIAASIDRSLAVSAQVQVSSRRIGEALFAFEIDLPRMDAEVRQAIERGLRGELSDLLRLGAAEAGAVRIVSSVSHTLRSRRTSWRINLLGVLNAMSVREFLRDSTVAWEPASGSLVAADASSARRIRVSSGRFAPDAQKLRQVLFESLMVTAALQSSRALGTTLVLGAEHTFLEQNGKARRRDLEEHFRALLALGLCNAEERDARLAEAAEGGTSTFLVSNQFDAAACDAMFLDEAGQPRPVAFYERIARDAFLALLSAADPERSYRRFALESDSVWTRVKVLGSGAESLLSAHLHRDGRKVAVSRSDIVTILWWARAMHGAGVALAAMRTFLGRKDAAELAGDPQFAKARERLSRALGDVVATSEARFDDPWDVLALDTAASRLGRLEAAIVTPRFAVRYTEAGEAGEAAPRAVAARSARGAVPVEARKAERQWTPEQLEVLSRHVVNLRQGKLSSDGSFASTREQVQAIFTRHIPAYAQEQAARGARPRVLFFAHGGLVEEEEGLLPVLARRQFWALNGVYPVYFVWETGLKETLRDIATGAIGRSRATRGGVLDGLIERGARRGGQPIWSKMKESAEKASGRGGGARLVAELCAALAGASPQVEFHAVGHSAGAIFHAHFLPLLTATPGVGVSSLHLLAPAVTVAEFKARLMPLVGSGKPITNLAMFTMTDEFEQRDSSMRPYGKSLLYLVSRSFEAQEKMPILGLQASVLQDAPLIRFFGLGGRDKVADVVFSVTDDQAPPRSRSRSVTHGGFDNDVSTMTSVVRRVLGAADSDAVVDYFEEPVEDTPHRGIGSPPRAAAGSAEPVAAVGGGPAVRRSGTRKKWTVMVWLAGDNDLEDFGDKDLAEMKRIGSTDDVDVVAQFDSMRDDRTRRYHLRRATGVDADVVAELGETNTGDPAVAVDFFAWAMHAYPAERTLAVIWNHGSGIDETDIYRGARARGESVSRGMPAAPGGLERRVVRAALSSRHRRALFGSTIEQAVHDRAIAYDDSSRDFLDNVELKRVLTEVKKSAGRPLDVLGFDACLMNMLEVAYQVRGTAGVMVGSEELEPGDGWPYDRVLQAINAQPSMDGAALGATVVREYVASYASGNVTQSALDLGRLEPVALAVDALAAALTKAIRSDMELAAVTRALNATQRFDTPDFVDLGHFCAQIGQRSKDAKVKAAAKGVQHALTVDPGLVLLSKTRGAAVSGATGAAIYFPARAVNKVYGKLDFAKATRWGRFLTAYHEA